MDPSPLPMTPARVHPSLSLDSLAIITVVGSVCYWFLVDWGQDARNVPAYVTALCTRSHSAHRCHECHMCEPVAQQKHALVELGCPSPWWHPCKCVWTWSSCFQRWFKKWHTLLPEIQHSPGNFNNSFRLLPCRLNFKRCPLRTWAHSLRVNCNRASLVDFVPSCDSLRLAMAFLACTV